VVDKDHITLDSSNVWTTLRFGRVLEVGIREVPHKGRYLWPHSMLRHELCMGVVFVDQPFKETHIEVKPFALLDSEVEIIDFRAQLSKIWSYG